MTFSLRDARFGYVAAERPAIDDITLRVRSGGHTIIIGPNGAGKSTLLRLMLGRLRPSSGSVELDGRPCADWPRRPLALRVALVSQLEPAAERYTVRELVAMGRYPHLPFLAGPSDRDRAIVAAAMERLDIASLADRRIGTLSGGELQRARLARAIAQESDILLLDEPTAHLDVGHEMALFELVSQLASEQKLTVVSVTHNMNLADRFADDLVLLARGRLVAHGPATVVLTADRLSDVYDWPMEVRDLPGVGRVIVARSGEYG